MENEILAPQIKIEDKILVIRGQHVMIDRDLAELYGVETRSLNQAVKRNIERFPERFMFQLTKEEIFSVESCSRSQIVILNEKKGRGSNIKYLPYVFTEQGVAILRYVSGRVYASTNISAIRISSGYVILMLVLSPSTMRISARPYLKTIPQSSVAPAKPSFLASE